MLQGGIHLKEFKYGNTTVTIHSPLTQMSKEEQRAWYKREWGKKNPVLQAIVEAAVACQMSATAIEEQVE